ncbi:hypothetical protein [Entomospira culicis]|uniref:Cobalt transport protein n=1 Tax=Entomospira culicis TaxID=2719989 RepID=A0A968GDX9_9SPIO|nr:hypothetical protein [Entomospira culicis]NIZ18569.1 hypothetical protein [Entomospira culicis]NIZ68784.1 hypothetical protein [Entomospira culicis]WDI37380.1 hypothetical protein PVA46_00915 [Entomospira culicis]WDI39009.1 hypothetical protein PVA47_00925 [Entomospira culicis]
MIADKRYLIPLWAIFLGTTQQASAPWHLALVWLLAIPLFMSYRMGKLIHVLYRGRFIILIALSYQLFSLITLSASWSTLLLKSSQITTQIILALLLYHLLNEADIIASIMLYLKPLHRPKWSADLAISILLVRSYLVQIPPLWRRRTYAITLRYRPKPRAYRTLITIPLFLQDLLEYPQQMSRTLTLRHYHHHFCPISYPKKSGDALSFFLYYGILSLVFVY